jgi:hypothetical protein
MRFRLAFIFSLLASAAFAQQKSVVQSGNVTPNTVPWWISSGVIGGGVTSADSPITSFGVTNNGANGICANSDRITAAGRNTICIGTKTNGPSQITVQNYGTATAQPLQFVVNGATYPFPIAPGGGIVGPNPSVIGDVAVWNNTIGTLLKDVSFPTLCGSNIFTSSLNGCVPASGGGTSNYLRADGTFAAPTTAGLQVGVTSIGGAAAGGILFNGAGTLKADSSLTFVSGGPLSIAPSAATNNAGTVTIQSTPNTGTVAGPISLNSITVIDNAQTVTGGFPLDSWGQITNQTDAFRLNYTVTGGSANHFGLNVASNITASNGGTVPLLSSCYVNVATITGDCWANIAVGNVGPAGNLNQSLIGYDAEMLVATGGTVLNRIGFSANSQGPVAASGIDAAFVVDVATFNPSPYNGAASWGNGIYFSNNLYSANQFPVATTGSLILADTGTVANFASAHTLTVTGNILDFPQVLLTGGGVLTLTTPSAGALRIGPNGTTNPTFQVDDSASSAANGVYVFSTAAGSGANITTISSASNEALQINGKGGGQVKLANVSTGGILVGGNLTFTPTTAGQLGTTTNNAAAAGVVGEYVESVVPLGSAVSLTNATPATMTSISLTAGDWDVRTLVQYYPVSTTSFTALATSLALVTNTTDITPGRYNNVPQGTIVASGSVTYSSGIPNYRFSLSGTTTIYATCNAAFTVSTMTCFGILSARRMH